MDFLTDFGVDVRLLIAQVINFLLLLFILKRFLYKPILKVLDERKEKIAESLKQVEEIEKRLTKTEEEYEKRLAQATNEAKSIINDANKGAEQILISAKLVADGNAEKIVDRAKQAMRLEQEKMYQKIRSELANLVAEGLKQITGKVLSEKDQRDLIKKSVKNISN